MRGPWARDAGDVHFISTSYSAWQSHKEGHFGDCTAAIRKNFAEASAHRLCVPKTSSGDNLCFGR